MKDSQADLIRQDRHRFSQMVMKAFPDIAFDESHPAEKFIGQMQVAGQKPIALFSQARHPYVQELILDG